MGSIWRVSQCLSSDTCTELMQYFLRSFRKFERYNFDKRYPEADHSKRGGVGPVTVGYFNHLSKGCDDFIKACRNIGIPFAPDFNTTIGTKGVNRVS